MRPKYTSGVFANTQVLEPCVLVPVICRLKIMISCQQSVAQKGSTKSELGSIYYAIKVIVCNFLMVTTSTLQLLTWYPQVKGSFLAVFIRNNLNFCTLISTWIHDLPCWCGRRCLKILPLFEVNPNLCWLPYKFWQGLFKLASRMIPCLVESWT